LSIPSKDKKNVAKNCHPDVIHFRSYLLSLAVFVMTDFGLNQARTTRDVDHLPVAGSISVGQRLRDSAGRFEMI
jgi:hypothetical protein